MTRRRANHMERVVAVKLHKQWRREYSRDRYLSHLSIVELSDRARQLVENVTVLGENGKIGIRDLHTDPGQHLMRYFTHVLEECDIRKCRPPDGFMAGAAIPRIMNAAPARLAELATIARGRQSHLFKFGKSEFLKNFSLRIALASSYSNPSLNGAQRDDELRIILRPNPKDVTVATLDGRAIDGMDRIEFTHESDRDYYVFCSSHAFDIRLFGDFEADSCLFIHDSRRFAQDLLEQVKNAVSIVDQGHQPVEYLDPVRPRQRRMPQVEFHKHFRYQYQNEFRHVFMPAQGQSLKKEIIVELPATAEYAELHVL